MSRLKGIDPGRLNHRVTIMRYQDKEDDLGNTVNVLIPYRKVWAEIKPLRGREELEYYKYTNTQTYRFVIRAISCPDLTEKDVFVYKDRQFQINTIADPLMDGYYFECQCTESKDHAVKEADDGVIR